MRLYLGELVQLSDELAHRSSRLRDDGRKILDAILTRLEALDTNEYGSSGSSAKADRGAFSTVRRELHSDWLRVDSMIDDLLSSAADELSNFANTAESRIAACERAVHHRKVGASTKAWPNNGELDSGPDLDRASAESSEDS